MNRRVTMWLSCVFCLLPMLSCADMAVYPRAWDAQRGLLLLLLWCIAIPCVFFFVLFRRCGVGGMLSFFFGFLIVALLFVLFVEINNVLHSRWGDGDAGPFLIWCAVLWAITYPFFLKRSRPLRALFTSLLVDILFVILYFGGLLGIISLQG